MEGALIRLTPAGALTHAGGSSAAGLSPLFFSFLFTHLTKSLVDFLNNQRTYQGLETRVGQDAPGVLEQGREGWAGAYVSENGRS